MHFSFDDALYSWNFTNSHWGSRCEDKFLSQVTCFGGPKLRLWKYCNKSHSTSSCHLAVDPQGGNKCFTQTTYVFSPQWSWCAWPWSLVWFFTENDTLVNAILVLIALHYIPRTWHIYMSISDTQTGSVEKSGIPRRFKHSTGSGQLDSNGHPTVQCTVWPGFCLFLSPAFIGDRNTVQLWFRWNEAY